MNVFVAARQINPGDVARELGLEEEYGRFVCPFHGDRTPTMACYRDTNRFYCFTCHAKGDAADLWAKVMNVPVRTAAEGVCEAFGLAYDRNARREVHRERAAIVAERPVSVAVWQAWREGMVTLLEEELEACGRLFERTQDPDSWLWKHAEKRGRALMAEIRRFRELPAEALAEEASRWTKAASARDIAPPAKEAAQQIRAFMEAENQAGAT